MRFIVGLVGLVALMLSVAPARAMDVATYRGLMDVELKELGAGAVADVPAALARARQMMEIGVSGCREFQAKEPKYARLMDVVIKGAPEMITLSDDGLEERWGDTGSAGDAVGAPLRALDQFSLARSYIDSVVHPATMYILVKKWSEKKDRRDLDQAKGELTELLQHLRVIETGK